MAKVAALLSGGVDSSVSVFLLKEQGITPDLYYIKIASDDSENWDCSEEEDWEMASLVARKYGCKLDKIDLHREYWDNVVGYSVERLRKGLTPNPDVMCNRLIKFGAFYEKIGHNYDFIATGHYASTEKDEQGNVWLTTSPDPVKDQTDFLAQLDNLQILHAMFPIGKLMKEDVRRIAEEQEIPSAKRKDSQGICFLGKIDYNELVRRYLGEKEGLIIDHQTGNILGRHKGYWFHTIGQRKGLGLAGGPWYVVGKDIRRNIVYVSRGFQTRDAYGNEFRIAETHFITLNPFTKDGDYDISFKIRHTPIVFPAILQKRGDEYNVVSSHLVQGIAPGQFAVIYDKDFHRCIGSGEIAGDNMTSKSKSQAI